MPLGRLLLPGACFVAHCLVSTRCVAPNSTCSRYSQTAAAQRACPPKQTRALGSARNSKVPVTSSCLGSKAPIPPCYAGRHPTLTNVSLTCLNCWSRLLGMNCGEALHVTIWSLLSLFRDTVLFIINHKSSSSINGLFYLHDPRRTPSQSILGARSSRSTSPAIAIPKTVRQNSFSSRTSHRWT